MKYRTVNPTIKYLSRALLMDLQIDEKFERIQQMRALAERRTAAYGHAAGGGGGAPDRRADVVARIVDAERELDAEINRMLDAKAEIALAIERVPDARMRLLLEMRYLNGYKWEYIAQKLEMSAQWTYTLHGRALEHVKKILALD